jgi:hypothetical protein
MADKHKQSWSDRGKKNILEFVASILLQVSYNTGMFVFWKN